MGREMNYTECPGKMLKRAGFYYTTDEQTDNKGRVCYVHTVEMPSKHTGPISVMIRGRAAGDCKIWCYPVWGIPESRRGAVLEKLNSLMKEYRFLKLVLDEENDVCASYDFWQVGDEENAVRTVGLCLSTFKDIVNSCIPEILKARYREEKEDNIRILKLDPFGDEEE